MLAFIFLVAVSAITLHRGDNDTEDDIYVYDATQDELLLITAGTDRFDALSGRISHDGCYVVFYNRDPLIEPDANDKFDVFRYGRFNETLEMISNVATVAVTCRTSVLTGT